MDGLRWFLVPAARPGAPPPLHVDALDDELRFHLEEEAEQLMADGVPADEAAAAARRSLGSPLAVRAHTRDVWTFPRLEQVCARRRLRLAPDRQGEGCGRRPRSCRWHSPSARA